jgi:uncharacterized membrane protein YebE (DUF533 family)
LSLAADLPLPICSRKRHDEKALEGLGIAELRSGKTMVSGNEAKFWRHCPGRVKIGPVAGPPCREWAVINATELLGQLLWSGISSSTKARLDHAMASERPGQPGGALRGLADAPETFIGADRSAARENPAAFGGSGALAGANAGGAQGALSGALGRGALAVLSGLALSALGKPEAARPRHEAAPAGGQARDPAAVAQPDQSATLILAAMINAAKADGQVDQEELQRIVGKLREVGADAEALDFVLSELRKPMDLEALIRRVTSEELGVQLYAASLLAIEMDTAAERQYLRRLAHGLGLKAGVVRRVHQCMGVGHAPSAS